MNENFINMCRLCLHVGDAIIPIFCEDKSSNICNTIISCAVINISKEDNLPKNICSKCSLRLQDSLAFKQQCEKSDQTLRKLCFKILSHNENTYSGPDDSQREISKITKNDTSGNTNKTVLGSENFNFVDNEDNGEYSNIARCKDRHNLNFYLECKTNTNNSGVIKGLNASNIESIDEMNVCFEVTQKKENLNVHNCVKLLYRKRKDREKKRACDVCDKLFENNKELKEHRSKHNGPYKCTFCIREFPTRSAQGSHERAHKNDDKSTKCELCNKEFQTFKRLCLHNVMHSREKKYRCSVCSTEFTHKCNLSRHMLSHENIKPYVCEICDKRFTRSASLKDHVNNSHNVRLQLHSCYICEYSNPRKPALRDHMFSKHLIRMDFDTNNISGNTPKKLFICNVCDKVLGSTQTLKAHLRTHTDSKEYLCRHCGKSFNFKSGLDGHERIHTGEKPYVCNLCDKRFRTQIEVSIHQLTHTGEKPHQCEVCLKRFSQRAHVRSHMHIHTGERKHVCDLCRKTFAHSTGLRYHKMTHTGETPNVCQYCGRGFNIPYKLKVHMEKRHSLQKQYNLETTEFMDQHLNQTKEDGNKDVISE